jgi:hypothetical protein
MECLSVRRIVPELTFKDYNTSIREIQDQVYEDFKMKYMRTLIFLFQSNEPSVIEHIVPTYFTVYSVELELHEKSV